MSNYDPQIDVARSSTARTLVVFPGALGDLICFLPALERLRAGGAAVTVLCKSDLVPLVRASGLAEADRIERPEASWLFSSDPPEQARGFYGGFSDVHSFSGKGVWEVERNLLRFLGARGRVHAFRPEVPIHLADHFLRCLGGPDHAAIADGPPLRVTADLAEDTRRRLAALPRPLLVVHPGSGGRAKRWSRAGFAAIVERCRRRGESVRVLLGPAEDADLAWWKRRVEVLVVPNLVEVALLLERSECYLGNDSGVSHLAAAVGARGLALFGPTNPELWRPLSARLVALPISPWRGCEESPTDAEVAGVERSLAAAISP